MVFPLPVGAVRTLKNQQYHGWQDHSHSCAITRAVSTLCATFSCCALVLIFQYQIDDQDGQFDQIVIGQE